MTKTSDGGPAFPAEGGINSGLHSHYGMTLRDYFAAKALPALVMACGGDTRESGQSLEQHVSKLAFDLADAMLKVRGETP